MNTVYAYFTSTIEPMSASTTTGMILIGFKEQTVNGVTKKIFASEEEIIPGKTVTLTGIVKNTGELEIYSVLRLEVYLGDEKTPYETLYYTPTADATVNSSSWKEVTESSGTYTEASKINGGIEVGFNIDYSFEFDDFDNSNQNLDITFVFTAGGIQTPHVDRDFASKTLIEDLL